MVFFFVSLDPDVTSYQIILMNEYICQWLLHNRAYYVNFPLDFYSPLDIICNKIQINLFQFQ